MSKLNHKTDQIDQLFELYRKENKNSNNRRLLIELDCKFSLIEDYVKDFKMLGTENAYSIASNTLHFIQSYRMCIRDITTPSESYLIK